MLRVRPRAFRSRGVLVRVLDLSALTKDLPFQRPLRFLYVPFPSPIVLFRPITVAVCPSQIFAFILNQGSILQFWCWLVETLAGSTPLLV